MRALVWPDCTRANNLLCLTSAIFDTYKTSSIDWSQRNDWEISREIYLTLTLTVNEPAEAGGVSLVNDMQESLFLVGQLVVQVWL